MIWIALLLGAVLLLAISSLRWGMRWGSTEQERRRPMPGDDYFEGSEASRVAMTRAVSTAASPEQVWPWIAQLGRGAGWYSIDWLDNGRKPSAQHLVSWIPDPRLGDATAIGYVRHIDPGSAIAWWLGKARFMGADVRMVTCFELSPERDGTRLISRISADARGALGPAVLFAFGIIDSIMARAQLVGVRTRAERGETGRSAETGARDQYQLYEVVFANGERAGVEGHEAAADSHQAAIEDGVLEPTTSAPGSARRCR